MKQKLLLVAFILISLFTSAQVEGPPPPAGYTDLYFCDEADFDGEITVDLTFLEEDFEVYGDTAGLTYEYYYGESLESVSITLGNPSNYTNSTNPYALRIVSSAGTELWYLIEIMPKIEINEPTPLEVCDIDDSQDGFSIIFLTGKNS